MADIVMAPIHPGRTLAKEIESRSLTANSLALKLRVSPNRITDIIRGNRSISPETALRLGKCLGTGAQYWMSLQSNYELALATIEFGNTVEKEVECDLFYNVTIK